MIKFIRSLGFVIFYATGMTIAHIIDFFINRPGLMIFTGAFTLGYLTL